MMSDVCCSRLTACNSEIHNGRMLYVKLYVCIKIQKVLRAHKWYFKADDNEEIYKPKCWVLLFKHTSNLFDIFLAACAVFYDVRSVA